MNPNKELSALDLMVQQSIQLVVGMGDEMTPISFGSGCIAKYRNRYFLLTVAHVTDFKDSATYIVTNKPPVNGKAEFYLAGTMNYFDEYSTKDVILNEIQGLDDLLSDFQETIDFGYCELKEQFEIIQPEIDFGMHKVEKSFKMFIDIEKDCANPSKDDYYGFYGNIRHNPTDKRLYSTVTLKYDLQYHRSNGRFHLFLAPDVINDADDYRGCSGAPILNNQGKLVGLAVAVKTNTKIVVGLSIAEMKRLLNYYIDIEEIESNNGR